MTSLAYMRDEFKILIGERTAEMVKIAIGSVIPGNIWKQKCMDATF